MPGEEPTIDDTTGQRVRVVLALGLVNLVLAAAAIVVASLETVR